MATREQMLIWLDEAQTAYHSLTLGGAVRVFVDQNAERIEYTAPNASRLLAYIRELERQLGLAGGVTGPMTAWW